SMRARDGFAISVVANMSVAKICSCQWLILHGLECVDIQDRNMMRGEPQITQHTRFGLTPSPFGTLLPSVATSYMLETLSKIGKQARI
ncbi:MAG: hypothetical protein KKA10_15625, partial [Euryarchaeota archaeon]|nr:hypothetical protein [Euryarchaeota archaeon]MCG2737758.1 hypothetical protein [Candidatus Methanoperedenaceae archaeon]